MKSAEEIKDIFKDLTIYDAVIAYFNDSSHLIIYHNKNISKDVKIVTEDMINEVSLERRKIIELYNFLNKLLSNVSDNNSLK